MRATTIEKQEVYALTGRGDSEVRAGPGGQVERRDARAAWTVPGGGASPAQTGEVCDCQASFGYVNLPGAGPEQAQAVKQLLRAGARMWGWVIEEIFWEERPGSSAEFERMQEVMVLAEMRRVVVLSFTHLARDRPTQDEMLQMLENDLSADVVALDEDPAPMEPSSCTGTWPGCCTRAAIGMPTGSSDPAVP